MILYFVIFFMLLSCEDLLTIDPPKSRIDSDLVFASEATAKAAVTGMYNEMLNTTGFASGSNVSVTALAGLSSDEFRTFNRLNVVTVEFDENALNSANANVLNLWNTAYKSIYHANTIIEGLSKSGLPEDVKNPLSGEALFVRAFSHFYLVNLFGDVPIVTTTDYVENSKVTRQPADQVYDQIIEDLLAAESLMSTVYSGPGRVRPNKSSATALLARVYLFRKNWAKAEEYASAVIANPDYTLAPIGEVFLTTSQEAIWQLQPVVPTRNTNEGFYFIISTSTPRYYTLTNDLVTSFEVGDARLSTWMNSRVASNGQTYYYPFKYKIQQGTPGIEYSMIFRLAEQYLIRSEAYLQQNKLPEAIDDLDRIRERASLPLIAVTNPGISEENLLTAILDERRHEFFTEWGHRWLDLKRTERAISELSPIKPNLILNDLLYPIPAEELVLNPMLGKQNDGY